MANDLTITKSYSEDGTATSINESALDDFINSIETFLNTTKLTSDNLEDGSIGTTQIAASAITKDKIASSAVTATKLADGIITADFVPDEEITSAMKEVPTITTDGSDPGVGGISENRDTSPSTSVTAGGGWSTLKQLTLTTTGRCVKLYVRQQAEDGDEGSITLTEGAALANTLYRVTRNEATVLFGPTSGSSDLIRALRGWAQTTDTGVAGSAGTYTYEIQVSDASNSGSVAVTDMPDLGAYEL